MLVCGTLTERRSTTYAGPMPNPGLTAVPRRSIGPLRSSIIESDLAESARHQRREGLVRGVGVATLDPQGDRRPLAAREHQHAEDALAVDLLPVLADPDV